MSPKKGSGSTDAGTTRAVSGAGTAKRPSHAKMAPVAPVSTAVLPPAPPSPPLSAAAPPEMPPAPGSIHPKMPLAVLVLSALGVVYGDLGTSPLYTIKECFDINGLHPLAPSPTNVLGILSLIFWLLTLSVSIKYVTFVMRVNNRGEGGELALMALSLNGLDANAKRLRVAVTLLGLMGASLLYGDGMITPAISVLSAVEGLKVVTPVFSSYVVPITVGILAGLFFVQKHGTSRIGTVFGPIILLWFLVIGTLGVVSIAQAPEVLAAINPLCGIRFFLHNRLEAFFVLGSVFLCLTGGEALYTDMGHFGRRPIQLGWYFVAMPGLLLNYFGQGAAILHIEGAVDHPFFALVPRWGLIPMVILATMATIIASQAVISGAFSITRQAVLLGYLPRIPVIHTSSREIGQIFVPTTNRILCAATIGLVLAFRSSSGLAAAYGLAVTMTMVITTSLFLVVVRKLWGWSWWVAGPLGAVFLFFELNFLASALVKIPHGGWFPLLVAFSVLTMMTTWRKGRKILGKKLYERVTPLDVFVKQILPVDSSLVRVPGCAVFMSGNAMGTPPVLLHNIKYNKVVHEKVIIMNVTIAETPRVPRSERADFEEIGNGFYRVRTRFGFMESPNVREGLDICRENGLDVDMRSIGFFLGSESVLISESSRMYGWQQKLFSLMSRNAQRASPFFDLPPNQVVEIGVQVQL